MQSEREQGVGGSNSSFWRVCKSIKFLFGSLVGLLGCLVKNFGAVVGLDTHSTHVTLVAHSTNYTLHIQILLTEYWTDKYC